MTAVSPSAPQAPWSLAPAMVAAALDVSVERGLAASAVEARRTAHGWNRLPPPPRRSDLAILLAQFQSLMTALLAVAAVVSLVLGEHADAAAMVLVLLANAAIGFVMERRGVRSMEALGALERTAVRVRRDGRVTTLDAEALVPGDIVLLEGGDLVPADLRVLDASRLQADESALTGESEPTAKQPAPLPAATPLAERAGMLFHGTAITRGSAVAVVTATGRATELGAIARMVGEAEAEATPLERQLDQLGRRLALAAFALVLGILAATLLAGRATGDAVTAALALAVAAVPEGLPVIATIALARSLHLLARQQALVRRPSAIESIGQVRVICTDKTGTLTENRLTVRRAVLADGDVPLDDSRLQTLAEAGVLCSTAQDGQGDPLELALLAFGAALGVEPREVRARWPLMREEAFDPETRRMTTTHRHGEAWRTVMKGAPEAVLARCASVRTGDGATALDRAAWLARAERLAADGLRVIALAEGAHDRTADLVLLGFVGLADPPRADAAPAIAACREAGIVVVMVTGDHPVTARAIARQVGLLAADGVVRLGDDLEGGVPEPLLRDCRVFARVTPAQKLRLVALHQRAGAVVAMTGDGVNDAPALAAADVGIAMGLRGTAVARQAADVVLQDDAFATITAAVREGRLVVANLRAAVRYLLACNASELLAVGAATLAVGVSPLLPLQLLYLNLVTDVFPALALAAGRGDPASRRLREAAPARGEPLLRPADWRGIARDAAWLTAGTLGAWRLAPTLAPGTDPGTVAFLTLALAQLWHVLNLRAPGTTLRRNDVLANPAMRLAAALCLGLVGAAFGVPRLAAALGLALPDLAAATLALAASLAPTIVLQGLRALGGTDLPRRAPLVQ